MPPVGRCQGCRALQSLPVPRSDMFSMNDESQPFSKRISTGVHEIKATTDGGARARMTRCDSVSFGRHHSPRRAILGGNHWERVSGDLAVRWQVTIEWRVPTE